MRSFRYVLCTLVAVAAVVAVLDAAGQNPPAAAPLQLVPVNVRVVDRAGKPVTDLKQTDFTIVEDGLNQPIKYFESQNLAADPSAADVPLALRSGITLTPQNRRVFLVLLGLGRLEEATGTVTALTQFVRTKLLPQDLVAVFAYDRALHFTTDHEKAAQLLERFKKANNDLNMEIDGQMGPTGMAPLYGSKALPRKVQTKIDEVFGGKGATSPTFNAPDVLDPKSFANLSLDDFMFATGTTLLDQANLTVMLEYLRHFDGEKHILYATEKGMTWPNDENDKLLATAANDGRVVIHCLQAGGVMNPDTGFDVGSSINTSHQLTRSFQSLRHISELTGGIPALTEKTQAVVDRINDMTKTEYVIGYAPLNSTWNGNYRNITVKVNRPDVTLYYRHGYFRMPDPGTVNRRVLITNDRMLAAGNFRREVNDIKMKVAASQKGDGLLTIEAKINFSKINLQTVDSNHIGTLDFTVYFMDSGGLPVGTDARQVPVKLTDDEYKKAVSDSYPVTLKVPLAGGTASVRFIVYDYRSDLIGRTDTRVF